MNYVCVKVTKKQRYKIKIMEPSVNTQVKSKPLNLLNSYVCKNCNKTERVYTTAGELPKGWIELSIKANNAGDWYTTFDKEHVCSQKCMREILFTMESYAHLLAEV